MIVAWGHFLSIRVNAFRTVSFASDLIEMLVVEPICLRHHFEIETIISRLVAGEQQNRFSPRVEGIEDSVRSTLVLYAQFAHMSMSRSGYTRAMWVAKGWPLRLE